MQTMEALKQSVLEVEGQMDMDINRLNAKFFFGQISTLINVIEKISYPYTMGSDEELLASDLLARLDTDFTKLYKLINKNNW